jgi:hypothetical protein
MVAPTHPVVVLVGACSHFYTQIFRPGVDHGKSINLVLDWNQDNYDSIPLEEQSMRKYRSVASNNAHDSETHKLIEGVSDRAMLMKKQQQQQQQHILLTAADRWMNYILST